jgi:hypothetical protein
MCSRFIGATNAIIVREQDERKVAEGGREMTVSGKTPRGRKAKKAGHVPSHL